MVIFGDASRSNPQQASQAHVGGLGGVSALDEVSATRVAADIAQGADLIVAANVQNLADSQEAQVEFVTNEGSYLSKPQVVATEAKTNRDIMNYVVQAGDTVSSVARRFNITSNTIRWENNISGDNLSVGRSLRILPVSGIRYTVKDGDTPNSIAERFGLSSAAFLVAFNDAELTGLKAGDRIIVPDGQKPAAQPTYFSSGYGFAFGTTALYGGNGYSYGYCTWHAANRRQQIGRPIPRNLGNAVTWASLASAAGLPVNGTPKAGAVLWHKNTWIAGGLGHVGFVEKVNADGSIQVSDMNYPLWNAVTYRTIAPSEFGQYLFIH